MAGLADYQFGCYDAFRSEGFLFVVMGGWWVLAHLPAICSCVGVTSKPQAHLLAQKRYEPIREVLIDLWLILKNIQL